MTSVCPSAEFCYRSFQTHSAQQRTADHLVSRFAANLCIAAAKYYAGIKEPVKINLILNILEMEIPHLVE